MDNDYVKEYTDAIAQAIKPLVKSVELTLVEMDKSDIIDISAKMAAKAVEKYTAVGFSREEAITMYFSSMEKTFGALGKAK